ncbi:unnamed protein product [Vicia faba]|uniref:Uncharacterized protein n=1 Tax=Vicia faba TaxID=3906 RepID=A0AAV0ZGA2_VICFA|nr:unnamed protein product [Vicia faba]
MGCSLSKMVKDVTHLLNFSFSSNKLIFTSSPHSQVYKQIDLKIKGSLQTGIQQRARRWLQISDIRAKHRGNLGREGLVGGSWCLRQRLLMIEDMCVVSPTRWMHGVDVSVLQPELRALTLKHGGGSIVSVEDHFGGVASFGFGKLFYGGDCEQWLLLLL